jgi:hypothetical protein
MYNWSVDTARLKKDPDAWNIFQLEQAIHFGLNGKRLDSTNLRQYWAKLHLDPHKKTYLESLLWPHRS